MKETTKGAISYGLFMLFLMVIFVVGAFVDNANLTTKYNKKYKLQYKRFTTYYAQHEGRSK